MRSAVGILTLWTLVVGCAPDLETELELGQVPPPQPLPVLEPARPVPVLQLMPGDMTTAVRGTPPTLIVSEALDPEERLQVSTALGLVEWPSRRRVPTRVEVTSPEDVERPSVYHFTALPTSDLESHWYALVVDQALLPARLAQDELFVDALWPGHLVSRFTPSPTTIVTDVRTDPVEGGTRLTVRFSTRVRDRRAADALVRVMNGDGTASCRPEQDGLLQEVDGTQELTLVCRGASKAWRVEVDPSLRSLGGVALGEAYGDLVGLDVPADPGQRRRALASALGLEVVD